MRAFFVFIRKNSMRKILLRMFVFGAGILCVGESLVLASTQSEMCEEGRAVSSHSMQEPQSDLGMQHNAGERDSKNKEQCRRA